MKIINEALLPLINDGKLSMNKIHDLIYIKEFVDRVSTIKYLDRSAVDDIRDQYGVTPTVVTWGDYFQTELAASLLQSEDGDFAQAISTVKYDLMASYQIFNGKDSSFFEWVDSSYYEVVTERNSNFTEQDEEIIHLKILMDYYVNMGINDHFTLAEKAWYSRFKESQAV